MTPFGILLESFRRKRGLQQQMLAAETGVNSCYISGMEKGRKGPPSQQVLSALIRALELTQEEIQQFKDAASRSQKTIRIPEGTSVHEFELVYDLFNRLGTFSEEETDAFRLLMKINSKRKFKGGNL